MSTNPNSNDMLQTSEIEVKSIILI